MSDLYNSPLGKNTRRVKPNSMHVPKITPVMVYNDSNNWLEESDSDNYLPNSQYQEQNGTIFRLVQAIQQYCEIYEISNTSYSNRMTILCRDSSIPYNTGDDFNSVGNNITKLTVALQEAFPEQDVYAQVGLLTDDDTDG